MRNQRRLPGILAAGLPFFWLLGCATVSPEAVPVTDAVAVEGAEATDSSLEPTGEESVEEMTNRWIEDFEAESFVAREEISVIERDIEEIDNWLDEYGQEIEKNRETAAADFKTLENRIKRLNATLEKIEGRLDVLERESQDPAVRFSNLQASFNRGDWEGVVARAPGLLNSPSPINPAIVRFSYAESLFQLEWYQAAISEFEVFIDQAGDGERTRHALQRIAEAKALIQDKAAPGAGT